MHKPSGFAWFPLLIIVATLAVVGVVTYGVVQTTSENKSGNANTTANLVVNSLANVNISSNANRATNTNVTANTNRAANVNATINTNSSINTNTSVNTNRATSNPIDIPGDWLTYTNTTYGYSIQYSPEYTPSGTADRYQFRKGTWRGEPTQDIFVYSLTSANHEKLEQSENFPQGYGWYNWALDGFPSNGSTVAGRFFDKRQETYGTNTFTVFDDDMFGTLGYWYYLVNGETVFIIRDSRSAAFDESIVQAMLASFTILN